MVVLFENHYTRTPELIKELYRYLYFKRPFMVFIYILFVLSFLANMGALIVSPSGYPSDNISFIIFIPLFFALEYGFYVNSVKSTITRDKETNNGKALEIKTYVTDEFIRFSFSTGSITELPYSNIKKVIQTKNLILLHSKANLLYTFHKGAFNEKSPSEFLYFLQKKGFNVG